MEQQLDYAAVRAAAGRIAGAIRPAAVVPAAEGVWYALEYLQHTGSFKARGARNFLAAHHRGRHPPGGGRHHRLRRQRGPRLRLGGPGPGVPATVFLLGQRAPREGGAAAGLRGGGPAGRRPVRRRARRVRGVRRRERGSRQPRLRPPADRRRGRNPAGRDPGRTARPRHRGRGGRRRRAVRRDRHRRARARRTGGRGRAGELPGAERRPGGGPRRGRGRGLGGRSDSLGATRVSADALAAARYEGVRSVLVPDQAITAARRALWEEHRIVVEAGAATALAALRTAPQPLGGRVAVVLCGANTDPGDLTAPGI